VGPLSHNCSRLLPLTNNLGFGLRKRKKSGLWATQAQQSGLVLLCLQALQNANNLCERSRRLSTFPLFWYSYPPWSSIHEFTIGVAILLHQASFSSRYHNMPAIKGRFKCLRASRSNRITTMAQRSSHEGPGYRPCAAFLFLPQITPQAIRPTATIMPPISHQLTVRETVNSPLNSATSTSCRP